MSPKMASKMAATLVICLCLLFSAEGEVVDNVVENVAASVGKVKCTAGEFQYTENVSIALQNITAPSRIIRQFRGINSPAECTSLCCDFVGCNVASFITLQDIKVCALADCVNSWSCLWQVYPQGVAAFLDRQPAHTTMAHVKETTAAPQTTANTTVVVNTTVATTTGPAVVSSTTPEVSSSDLDAPMDDEDSWWFNPFNWGRPPPKEYPDNYPTEKPTKKPSTTTISSAILNAILNQNKIETEQPLQKTTPFDTWDFEKEMLNPDSFNINNYDGLTDRNPHYDDSNTNLSPPTVNNQHPPEVPPPPPKDGVKQGEMATSWQDNKPMPMPEKDNTTYTIGLAVFLASLGLAGVLVLTIHFISKKKQKSRYSLLQVEEEINGDKQPFLPRTG